MIHKNTFAYARSVDNAALDTTAHPAYTVLIANTPTVE
jgi:hypothetical protein